MSNTLVESMHAVIENPCMRPPLLIAPTNLVPADGLPILPQEKLEEVISEQRVTKAILAYR